MPILPLSPVVAGLASSNGPTASTQLSRSCAKTRSSHKIIQESYLCAGPQVRSMLAPGNTILSVINDHHILVPLVNGGVDRSLTLSLIREVESFHHRCRAVRRNLDCGYSGYIKGFCIHPSIHPMCHGQETLFRVLGGESHTHNKGSS